ncbi:MAG TPA: hypothetical protein VFV42_01750 [Acidimicrobiales bacterium]|nr:hypothetical protein [Acidimicrobiales bacterium]
MIRRIGAVAVAASVVAGLGTVIVPQHAASLAAVAAATVAVVAATFLLVVAGPLVAAPPPAWPGAGGRAGTPPPLDPQGLRDARREVARRLAAGTSARALLAELQTPSSPGGTR